MDQPHLNLVWNQADWACGLHGRYASIQVVEAHCIVRGLLQPRGCITDLTGIFCPMDYRFYYYANEGARRQTYEFPFEVIGSRPGSTHATQTLLRVRSDSRPSFITTMILCVVTQTPQALNSNAVRDRPQEYSELTHHFFRWSVCSSQGAGFMGKDYPV